MTTISINDIIGTELNIDGGVIVDIDTDDNTVTVAWDGEVKTTEPMARLADWGIELA